MLLVLFLYQIHSGNLISALLAPYDINRGVFKWVFFCAKVLPHSCPADMFNHWWDLSYEVLCKFVSQAAIEITLVEFMACRFHLIKRDFFWSFQIWQLVFLVPLKIQTHTVPHMKGLIYGQNISGRQEHGCTFTKKKTHLNTPHFTSYRGQKCGYKISPLHCKSTATLTSTKYN